MKITILVTNPNSRPVYVSQGSGNLFMLFPTEVREWQSFDLNAPLYVQDDEGEEADVQLDVTTEDNDVRMRTRLQVGTGWTYRGNHSVPQPSPISPLFYNGTAPYIISVPKIQIPANPILASEPRTNYYDFFGDFDDLELEDILEPKGGILCTHEWKVTPGIFRVYEDCIHCGVKKEDVEKAAAK